MKTIKITALFLLMMITTGIVMAQSNSQQLTVPLSNPGKPYKLDVHIQRGSIKVVAYEGKDVMIDILTDSTKDRDEKQAPAGMKHITAGGSIDVTAEENDNTVEVSTGEARKLESITIKVPQGDATIKLSTINNGNISVSNVSGDIEVDDVNGSIDLKDIAGSAVASSVNGHITVNFKSVDPKAAMAFSTLNGSVDVTFPADTKANVKLKSDRGEMYSDFDIDVDKSQPKVDKTSGDHMYRVKIEDWIYGKINGGGPETMMKTMNGNIYIRKAK